MYVKIYTHTRKLDVDVCIYILTHMQLQPAYMQIHIHTCKLVVQICNHIHTLVNSLYIYINICTHTYEIYVHIHMKYMYTSMCNYEHIHRGPKFGTYSDGGF